MANKVTIDIEGRFVDRTSQGVRSATSSIKKLDDAIKKTQDRLNKMSNDTGKVKVEANTSKFDQRISQINSKLRKFTSTKANAVLGATDKAKSVLASLLPKLREFGGKTWRGILSVSDKASPVLQKVGNSLKSITRKALTAPIKILDYATAPIRKIGNALLSLKAILMGVAATFAAQKLIISPVSIADSYSSSKIGFQTLLGEEQGQQMMDDLDQFAKATPFKTSEVISNAQRMMAMGWDSASIIEDMTTIGDAAAATGKGEEGLNRITLALAQIKSKGRLSTEELNQLAEAGISAKRYLAEGLGYGSGDEGIAALSKDLEQGAIGAEAALKAITEGMKEYSGMMDKTANETVSGLKSQIEDAFEISIFRRWGQGLQQGAKEGLGYIVDLLDNAGDGLDRFGDKLEALGAKMSGKFANGVKNVVETVQTLMQDKDFQNAGLGGKALMLWDEIIAKPFKNWWKSTGKATFTNAASDVGKWLGEGITKFFKTGSKIISGLFGGNKEGIAGDASEIGGAFWKSFTDSFDGKAITDAIVSAISDVWGALPGWAKFLVGGYAAGHGLSALGKGLGIISTIKNSGLAGGIKSAGGGLYSLLGGYVGRHQAGITGLQATAGLTSGLGYLAGAYGLYQSGSELVRGFKATDKDYGRQQKWRGGIGLGAIGTGTAIGAMLGGPLGAGIGAGAGWLVDKLVGNKVADSISGVTDEYLEQKAALEELQEEARALSSAQDKIAASGGNVEAAMKRMSDAEQEAYTAHEALKKSFKEEMYAGGRQLTAGQISDAINSRVPDRISERYEKFQKALEDFQNSYSSVSENEYNLDKLHFQLKSGDIEITKENAAEVKDSIMSQMKDYVKSVTDWLGDFQFMVTTATGGKPLKLRVNGKDVELDLDASTADIIDGFESDLDKAISKYEITLDKAIDVKSPGGVEITIDEAKAIEEAKAEVFRVQAEIEAAINEAQRDAELITIKHKYEVEAEKNGGALDEASKQALYDELDATLEKYIEGYDGELTAKVAALNLSLDQGKISQAEYDAALEKLLKNYDLSVEEVTAVIEGIKMEFADGQLDLNIEGAKKAAEQASKALSETYSDTLSKSAPSWIEGNIEAIADVYAGGIEEAFNAGALNMNLDEFYNGIANGLKNADVQKSLEETKQTLSTQIEAIQEEISSAFGEDWTFEELAAKKPELAAELTNLLQMEDVINAALEGNLEAGSLGMMQLLNSMIDSIEEQSPQLAEALRLAIANATTDLDIDVEGKVNLENLLSTTVDDAGNLWSVVEDTLGNTFAVPYNVLASGNVSMSDLKDGTYDEAAGVWTSADGSLSLVFATPFNKDGKVDVNLSTNAEGAVAGAKAEVDSAVKNKDWNATASGTLTVKMTVHEQYSKYGASLAKYKNIQEAAFSADGRITDGPMLSWIGEDGPEAVIPLSSKRRKRGLDLWLQAGEALGVMENANGGIYGGSSGDEGESIREISQASAPVNTTVKVEVGGIVFQIETNGSPESIESAIRRQAPQIAETVAEELNKAFSAQFANMPTRA